MPSKLGGTRQEPFAKGSWISKNLKKTLSNKHFFESFGDS
jgi:hypothetical protein